MCNQAKPINLPFKIAINLIDASTKKFLVNHVFYKGISQIKDVADTNYILKKGINHKI